MNGAKVQIKMQLSSGPGALSAVLLLTPGPLGQCLSMPLFVSQSVRSSVRPFVTKIKNPCSCGRILL